jgi:predicted DNA-binding protein
MSVMSIRIDPKKRNRLKTIASVQGKSMSSIVEELIDTYVDDFIAESATKAELDMLMKVSEPAFDEWNNDEDDIYDTL